MLAGCYSIVSVCYNKMDELISAKRQVPAGNFLPISPKCTWMVQIWYQVLDLITKCQVYQGKKSTQLQRKRRRAAKERVIHIFEKNRRGGWFLEKLLERSFVIANQSWKASFCSIFSPYLLLSSIISSLNLYLVTMVDLCC